MDLSCGLRYQLTSWLPCEATAVCCHSRAGGMRFSPCALAVTGKTRWPAHSLPRRIGLTVPQGIPTGRVETLCLPLVVLTSRHTFCSTSYVLWKVGNMTSSSPEKRHSNSLDSNGRLLRLGLAHGVGHGHGRSVATGIQNPPASSTFGTGIPCPPTVPRRGSILGTLGPFVMLGH